MHRWQENTRKLRLLSSTIIRMLEVSHLNQTYVSILRVRHLWSRWTHTVTKNNNKIKACRMVVRCYRKILRFAVYTWRRNADHHRSALQVRRLAMQNLLQMARMHGFNRFFIWKSATQQLRAAEEHVEKLGVVLKRLRVIRRKRRAWGAWKTLFAQLNSPISSSGATLRVCGPKYINAITRAQYWSSTLLRSVLVHTTLEPVLNLALEALQSVLPEYCPSLYYLHHEHEYLWGHALSPHHHARQHSPLPVRSQSSPVPHLSRSARGSVSPTTALQELHLSSRFSPVPHEHSMQQEAQYFPVTLSPFTTSARHATPRRSGSPSGAHFAQEESSLPSTRAHQAYLQERGAIAHKGSPQGKIMILSFPATSLLYVCSDYDLIFAYYYNNNNYYYYYYYFFPSRAL